MKLNTQLLLVVTSSTVVLYLHSLIHLHGIVLTESRTQTTLPFLFTLPLLFRLWESVTWYSLMWFCHELFTATINSRTRLFSTYRPYCHFTAPLMIFWHISCNQTGKSVGDLNCRHYISYALKPYSVSYVKLSEEQTGNSGNVGKQLTSTTSLLFKHF